MNKLQKKNPKKLKNEYLSNETIREELMLEVKAEHHADSRRRRRCRARAVRRQGMARRWTRQQGVRLRR